MALAPGSPEEHAVILAQAVAPGSPDRLAAWLALYDALGIPVIAEDGSPVGTTGDDPIGPPYWRIWHASGMTASPAGLALTDFARLFGPDDGAFDHERAAAALLEDLRATTASDDSRVRLFGLFIAEMARTGPAPVDWSDPAVGPGQVAVPVAVAELLAWVVIRGLVHAEAASGDLTDAPEALSATGFPLLALASPLADQAAIPSSPAVFAYAPGEKCSEAAGDEQVTAWLDWALNKLGGGIDIPLVGDVTKGFVEIVQEHLGASKDRIEKTKKVTGIINKVTSLLTLAMQIAALRFDATMEPDPLVRSDTTRDGNEAKITLRLFSDPEGLPDGDQLYACMATFLLNAFGIELKAPTSEDIPGAELSFEPGQGFEGRGDYVLWRLMAGGGRQAVTETDANGQAVVEVLGKGQPRDIRPGALPWYRMASFHVSAQPQAVTGKTLLDIFIAGLGRDAAKGAIEIAKTLHYELGTYEFEVKDWAAYTLKIEWIGHTNAEGDGGGGCLIARDGWVEIPLEADGRDDPIITGKGTLVVVGAVFCQSEEGTCEAQGENELLVEVEGALQRTSVTVGSETVTGQPRFLNLKTSWTLSDQDQMQGSCTYGQIVSMFTPTAGPFVWLPGRAPSPLESGFLLQLEDGDEQSFVFPDTLVPGLSGETTITVTLVKEQ